MSFIVLFWRQVSSLLTSLLGKAIPLHTLIYLLGLPPKGIMKMTSRLMSHVLTAARCLIPKRWKSVLPPAAWNLYRGIPICRTPYCQTTQLLRTVRGNLGPMGLIPLGRPWNGPLVEFADLSLFYVPDNHVPLPPPHPPIISFFSLSSSLHYTSSGYYWCDAWCFMVYSAWPLL